LVSVGNLIAGSRAATSPTTLLGMIVSLDPVYFNFDMSEADYLQFSRGRDFDLVGERTALRQPHTHSRAVPLGMRTGL
jgi:hypothetical protein